MRMSSVRKMAYLTAVFMTAGSFVARADIITTATAPGAAGTESTYVMTSEPIAITSPALSSDVTQGSSMEKVTGELPSVSSVSVGTESVSSVSGPGASSGSSGEYWMSGPGVSGAFSSANVSSPGAGSSSGVAGANHASDQGTMVELGFKLVSPAVQKGGIKVAEGSVQLSDGSWASITHDYDIRNPYFRVLREVTDTQGIDWYVCATHATKIGNYYTADGSMATELWLKKSDCTELSSLTIRTTDQTRIGIVRTALENLGDDYTYGMTGPDEFDCSGFVNYVMAQNGISVPRQSSAICQMSGQISIEDLRPGDIVGRPGHVGVYIGDGIFVHSSETSTGVIAEYVDMYNTYNGFTNYINVVGG